MAQFLFRVTHLDQIPNFPFGCLNLLAFLILSSRSSKLLSRPDSFVAGISLSTPFGTAGVYANYNISGDASQVTFGLNVDLCVVTFILTTCASTLGVPNMPVTLINGTYDFSSLCT